MNSINEYAKWTDKTWKWEGTEEKDLTLATLGLAGETGEFVEKIKKYLRDGTLDKEAVAKELGDVIYYWSRLCIFLGFAPTEILDLNIKKLEDRAARNTLHGSGDNR